MATDDEIRSLLNESELEKEFLMNRRKSREGNRKNKEVKIIDWKETLLYKNCISGRLKPYNYIHDPKYFTENEIDYVIEMIQQRLDDFMKDNLIKAFYLKSSLTLYKLVEY